MTLASAPILQIFAREPVAGGVKTRLAAAIGAERAVAAYRELTATTLEHARRAQAAGIIAAVEIWCSPSARSSWFDACAATVAASLHEQLQADLGMRMQSAIAAGLTRTNRVLLIGTDCPVLDATALAAAAAMLHTHDAVLTPAEDGGFVLVGARVPLAFDGVQMSTPSTVQYTLARFAQQGLQCGVLPALWDVDVVADLERWQQLRVLARAPTA